MNPIGLTLTPTINNQVILNDQHIKVQVGVFGNYFIKEFFFDRMIHIKQLLCDHHVVLISVVN